MMIGNKIQTSSNIFAQKEGFNILKVKTPGECKTAAHHLQEKLSIPKPLLTCTHDVVRPSLIATRIR
jgi:hypothetical protein